MSSPPIRTALFIDFDNIFSSLANLAGSSSVDAAIEFAMRPDTWQDYFAQGLHDPAEDGTRARRNLLIRRCYLNPTGSYQRPGNGLYGAERLPFHRYRPNFTQAGFAVVDCPPITRMGKNSADIVMVMDILDTLTHPVRFDEFIILSADADFTPVMMRLRANDRRIATMVSDNTARAFRASSDVLLHQEEFATFALGFHGAATERRGANHEALEELAVRLSDHMDAHGPTAVDDFRRLFAEWEPRIGNRDYLRYLKFSFLAEEVARRTGRFEVDRSIQDAWTVRAAAPPHEPHSASMAAAAGETDSGHAQTPLQELAAAVLAHVATNGWTPINDIRGRMATWVPRIYNSNWLGFGKFTILFDRIAGIEPALQLDKSEPATWRVGLRDDGAAALGQAPPDQAPQEAPAAKFMRLVRNVLAVSPAPVPLATLGQVARSHVPDLIGSDWDGAGTLGSLLDRENDPTVAVLRFRTGFAYDPRRHDPAAVGAPATAVRMPPPAPSAEIPEDVAGQLPGAALATGATATEARHEAAGAAAPGQSPHPDAAADGTVQHAAALFEAVAEELRSGTYEAGSPWAFEALVTAVEESCADRNVELDREAIAAVLTTIEDDLARLLGEDADAATLAQLYRDRRAAHHSLSAGDRPDALDPPGPESAAES